MSTEAYNSILAKLKRGGRERLDGFAPSDFAGVTDRERDDLLSVFKESNDFQALDSLLPKVEFANLLRNSVERLEYKSDAYVEALIWATKTGAIDDGVGKLVDCLATVSTWAAGNALSFLAGSTISSNDVDRYIDALVLVLRRRDATAPLVLKASAELLRLKGFKPRSIEYIEFSKRLLGKDGKIREQALVELIART